VKLGTLVMFGVGYVLGTKAGHDRYEQICRMAQMASERLEEYSANSTWATGAVPRDRDTTERDVAAL